MYCKDLCILKYLYEECQELLQNDESDVILLLKMCIQLKWEDGFMCIINSITTDNIFMHSSKEFKTEYI